MSYLTQMAGLAYHNFVSAAVGIALAIAVIRGIARRNRKTTRQLLGGHDALPRSGCCCPVCLVGALFLVSQGVVQNFKPYATAELIEPQTVQVTGLRRQNHHADRHATGHRARAGRLAGSHQGIRHQRRRILQRQQRPSV